MATSLRFTNSRELCFRVTDHFNDKIIVHARDRDRAIARMLRALEATVVEGIKTTIPLQRQILDIPLNTVKSHIRRGKERLAVILETQERPPAARAVTQQPQREQRGPFSGAAPLRLMFGLAGR